MSIDNKVEDDASFQLKDFIPIYGMFRYSNRVGPKDFFSDKEPASEKELVNGPLLGVYNIALAIGGFFGIQYVVQHWFK